MPMDYLMRIRHETFPLTITDHGDINSAAVLLAAGLIDATVPLPSVEESDVVDQPPAVIRGITPLGRLEIAKRKQIPPS